jgi:methylmalonyl-CoA mutase C-terminal domain/subunit
MPARRVRILLGKMGEGFKETLLNLARNFREAGYEVIYTELEEPEAIVRSAIQESVDHIGITTLPGTNIQAFAEINQLLREQGADRISVTAGGYLDDEDVPKVRAMGVMEFFPKGTTFDELIEWSRENIKVKNV